MAVHARATALRVVIFGGLVVPLRALIIALSGAAIAWGWYGGHRWAAFVAPAAAVLVGFAVSEVGVRIVKRNPVLAVHLMPWRILVPAAIAAVAGGVVVIVTVALTLPDKTASGAPTPTNVKEVVSAVSTAVTGFLSSAFIDWTADAKDSRLADWISSVFGAAFLNRFADGSKGANLVFSDFVVDGWGRKARLERAEGIANELKASPTVRA